MAALENGQSAVGVASGAAAVLMAVMALAKAGDNIVSSAQIYSGTFTQFDRLLPSFGVRTKFMDRGARNLRDLIDEHTKLVFCESLANPDFAVADYEELVRIAHEAGVPVVVDATFTGAGFFGSPIDFGVDIVVHSATKWISGHGTTIGGVVIDSGKFDWSAQPTRFPQFHSVPHAFDRQNPATFWNRFGSRAFTAYLRLNLQRDVGSTLSPFSAQQLLIGMETLSLRCERQAKNAAALAEWLRMQRPAVAWVAYVGFKDHPAHPLAVKYLRNGYSSVLTFGLAGGQPAVFKFIDRLKLIINSSNVGDSKTIVGHLWSTTCVSMTDEERHAGGVTDDLIRISAGTENVEDIIDDMRQSLDALDCSSQRLSNGHPEANGIHAAGTFDPRSIVDPQNRTLTAKKFFPTFNAMIPTTPSSNNPLTGTERSRLVVQKFGGTSIGKFPLQIVRDVIMPNSIEGKVVVVCSARSGTSKPEGTTERSAMLPQSSQYKVLVECLRKEHVLAVHEYIKSPAISRCLVQGIIDDCTQVLDILDSVHLIGAISPDTLDRVISAGEKLACRLMSGVLQDHGVSSEYVDLSQVAVFPTDRIIDQAFYDELSAAVGCAVRASKADVPVVTGYFGRIPGGLLCRIGRGYTDLCAALLTMALGAEELQVWKEVEGFYTADPRRVPSAKPLPSISPHEAAELTFNGSEIIHFLAMGQAVRSRIPIRVKNVMNPSGVGTLIRPESSVSAKAKVSDNWCRSFDYLHRDDSSVLDCCRARSKKGPAAMTSKHNILVVNVLSQERSLRPSFFMNIIAVLGRWELPIDLVCTSQVQMSMVIQSKTPSTTSDGVENDLCRNAELVGAIEQLRELGTVNVLPDMAVISLVGQDMRCHSGTAGRVFTVLGDNDINIEMIAQGASEISISCVVAENVVDRAMNLLHESLFAWQA
ncbi:MAG: hypothetical protein Q9206_005186 [Seirophora lacunosa]